MDKVSALLSMAPMMDLYQRSHSQIDAPANGTSRAVRFSANVRN